MSSETDVHQREYSQQDDKTSLFSTLKGAFFKAIFVLGSAFLVFESTRNSLTYHVGKLWGGVGDVWQELWEKVLSVTGKFNIFCEGHKILRNLHPTFVVCSQK